MWTGCTYVRISRLSICFRACHQVLSHHVFAHFVHEDQHLPIVVVAWSFGFATWHELPASGGSSDGILGAESEVEVEVHHSEERALFPSKASTVALLDQTEEEQDGE